MKAVTQIGKYIFLGYAAFVLAGFLFLVSTWLPESPAKINADEQRETRMLERCAEALALAMDKKTADENGNSDLSEFNFVHTVETEKPSIERNGRTLKFAENARLGEVFESSPEKNIFACQWKKIGEARGNVIVNKSNFARIKVYPAADNLDGLKLLKPNDIQEIDASRTPLRAKDLDGIDHLSGLISLNLKNGNFGDEALPHLLGLKKLFYLELTNTEVSDAIFNLAGAKIPALSYLSLTGCKNIKALNLPKHLAHNTVLQVLNLSDTSISSEGIHQLSALENVTTLYLSGNDITDDDLKKFAKTHTHLQAIDLARTRVSGSGLKHLRVQTLSLAGCPVNDKSITDLAEMNLLVLNLADTGITDEAIPAIMQNTEMTNLDLGGTKISSRGIRRLVKLKKLVRLTVPADIDASTISKIKKELPACNILQHYS